MTNLPPPVMSPPGELDSRNRAAKYILDAQQQLQQKDQQGIQQKSGEFQQLLWIKNLDHQYQMEQREAEHRHTLELEEKKKQAAIELRELDLKLLPQQQQRQQVPGRGLAAANPDVKPGASSNFDFVQFIKGATALVGLIVALNALLKPSPPVQQRRHKDDFWA